MATIDAHICITYPKAFSSCVFGSTSLNEYPLDVAEEHIRELSQDCKLRLNIMFELQQQRSPEFRYIQDLGRGRIISILGEVQGCNVCATKSAAIKLLNFVRKMREGPYQHPAEMKRKLDKFFEQRDSSDLSIQRIQRVDVSSEGDNKTLDGVLEHAIAQWELMQDWLRKTEKIS